MADISVIPARVPHTCLLERDPSAAALSEAHRAEEHAAHQSKRARLESPESTSKVNIESGTTRVRLWHNESGLVIKALANSIATGSGEEQHQQRTALAPGEQQKQQTAAHPSCHR